VTRHHCSGVKRKIILTHALSAENLEIPGLSRLCSILCSKAFQQNGIQYPLALELKLNRFHFMPRAML
jgi:hypothetical protein